MKKIIFPLLAALLLLLCACGNQENTPSLPKQEQFVPDYTAGNENKVGNIWTNRTFCRQDDYVYYFDSGSKTLKKWQVDAGFESAKTICAVDTKMFLKDDDTTKLHTIYQNHMEVVGDYIYLGITGGDTVGTQKLTAVLRVRTDGKEQKIIVSDCSNFQYRIVNNVLFYMALTMEQESYDAQDYYMVMKTLDLSGQKEAKEISGTKIKVTDSVKDTYKNQNNRQDRAYELYVEYDAEAKKYVTGYAYLSWSDREHFRMFELIENNDTFTVADQEAYDDSEEWQSYFLLDYVCSLGWMLDGKSNCKSISEDYTIGVFAKPSSDNGLGYSRTAGMFLYDWQKHRTERQTGVHDPNIIRKVNDDQPKYVEYVGDGKLYYYMQNNGHEYTLCSCNLDGSDWQKLATF